MLSIALSAREQYVINGGPGPDADDNLMYYDDGGGVGVPGTRIMACFYGTGWGWSSPRADMYSVPDYHYFGLNPANQILSRPEQLYLHNSVFYEYIRDNILRGSVSDTVISLLESNGTQSQSLRVALCEDDPVVRDVVYFPGDGQIRKIDNTFQAFARSWTPPDSYSRTVTGLPASTRIAGVSSGKYYTFVTPFYETMGRGIPIGLQAARVLFTATIVLPKATAQTYGGNSRTGLIANQLAKPQTTMWSFFDTSASSAVGVRPGGVDVSGSNYGVVLAVTSFTDMILPKTKKFDAFAVYVPVADCLFDTSRKNTYNAWANFTFCSFW